MDKITKLLMQLNNVHSLDDPAASREELETAVLELAQNQSDIEDAIVELAELIGG